MSQANKTIAQKSEELSELVSWFDSEDFNLEIAVDKFKQAEKLANSIEKDLLELKNGCKWKNNHLLYMMIKNINNK